MAIWMFVIVGNGRAQVYFDVNGSAAGSGVTGGSSYTWSTSTANWTSSTGGTTAASNWSNGSNIANFAAGTDASTSAFTLNLGTNITMGGIQVTEGNVSINTGSFTLTQNASSTFTVGSGLSLSVAGKLNLNSGSGTRTLTVGGVGNTNLSAVISNSSGTGAIYKTGTGTLTLSGANTYTGTTTVSQGTLQVNANAPSGSAGALGNATSTITVNDGSTGANNTALLIGTSGVSVGRTVTVANSGTGTTTLGGNITSGTGTFSGTVALNRAANLNADGTSNVTFSGVISGAGAVTKTGTGTVTLSGTNTYTGATTISQGTLQVNANAPSGSAGALGNATSTITLNNASTGANDTALLIGASGVTIGRTVTVANSGSGTTTLGGNITSGTGTFSGAVTLNRSASLNADGTSNITFSGALGGAGGVTKTGAGTVTLSGTNTYSGGTTLNAGTLALGNNSALSTGTLTVNGGTLSASGGARTISNAVTVGGDFSIGGSNNLNLSGTINLGGGTRTIDVSNTGTTTFSGVVSQPWYTSLVKNGSGRLELTNANTFSGFVQVGAGTLAISNANSLGSSGTWDNVVSSGATLEFSNNISVTEGGFTISGTGDGGVGALRNLSGDNTLTGQVVLGAATTINSTAGSLTLASYTDNAGYNLTTAGAGDLTFNGQINGSGALNKTGTGTLTLGAANSYTGGTTLAGGTTVINAANALGTSGNIAFTGGTLRYGTGVTTDFSSRIANSTSAIAVDTNGNNVAFASSLASTNTGGLTKSGSGTLTLSGANNYSGATAVNAGALNLQNSSALGSSSGVTVASGATLQLQGGTTITGKPLTLAGGTLESVSGANQWAGNITLSAASSIVSSTAGQTLAVGNNSFTNTITLGSNTLTVSGPGNTLINSFVGQSGDTGGFIKDGSGTVTFYGDRNYYTGATNVKDGTLVLDTLNSYNDQTILGSLTIGDGSGSAGSATVVYGTGNANNKIADTSTVTINADGLLDLNGKRDTIGALVMNGGRIDTRNTLGSQGILTLAGDVTVNASTGTSTIDGYQFSLNDIATQNNVRNITVGANSQLLINSQVVYGGINKLGTGTLTLTNSNTYGGTTTVSAGVLNIQNDNALGANGGGVVGSGTTVNSGAALQMQGSIAVGNEYLTLNGTGIASDGALRSLSGDNSWAGSINLASDSLVKTDSGTLTLTGSITSSANKNLTVGGAGDTYISGSIGTGNGTLSKIDSGTLFLSGNNTYQGTTTANAGVINISSNDALGSTVAGTTVANGAALHVQNNITVGNESLSLSGTGISGTGALRNLSGNNTYGGLVTAASATRINSDSGTLTLAGGVAVGANSVTVGGASNTTISGPLTGSSSGMLTKDGAGTLTVSSANNNSFLSDITLTSGTLAMAANNALNNAMIDMAINGGTFSLQTYAQTVGSITGVGEIAFGSGGSLTLSANSLFSGTFTGTGTLVVGNGVTLTLGTGFNAAGVTIVLAGGTLNLNGYESTFAGLTLTGNSTIDFAAGLDSVVHFTDLSLGSYALAVAGWTDAHDYFRVTNDPGNKGSAPLNQVTFAPSGSWVGNDTIWTGDYSGYTFNDEVRPWRPVPEPSTYGALFFAAALGFFGYRRWRQKKH